MNKLYFKYGTMGSSKTAQALMCRFNYIQKGFNVLLIKPSIDTRSEECKSRVGLSAQCETFPPEENLIEFFEKFNLTKKVDVIIVDECQFLTTKQVNELKFLTQKVPVLCYGLLTNFKTELFEGSKRLIEIADSIMEIKTVCKCGRKATINARLINGKVATEGPEVSIGGDESYEGLCYWCYQKELKK